MLPSAAKAFFYALIVLIGSLAIVHATTEAGVAQQAKSKGKSIEPRSVVPPAALDGLPGPVAEMRDGILEAVKSGRIEELKVPIAWNELPPTFAQEKLEDPITYWKKLSGDGDGREILAVLANLFAAGHVVLPVGRDVENSKLFVWPRFAEMSLDKLSPEDEVQLYRLITPAEVRSMREKQRWTWWRLAIGADGTWHSFVKTD